MLLRLSRTVLNLVPSIPLLPLPLTTLRRVVTGRLPGSLAPLSRLLLPALSPVKLGVTVVRLRVVGVGRPVRGPLPDSVKGSVNSTLRVSAAASACDTGTLRLAGEGMDWGAGVLFGLGPSVRFPVAEGCLL